LNGVFPEIHPPFPFSRSLAAAAGVRAVAPAIEPQILDGQGGGADRPTQKIARRPRPYGGTNRFIYANKYRFFKHVTALPQGCRYRHIIPLYLLRAIHHPKAAQEVGHEQSLGQ
jgi:hypothetical protein